MNFHRHLKTADQDAADLNWKKNMSTDVELKQYQQSFARSLQELQTVWDGDPGQVDNKLIHTE